MTDLEKLKGWLEKECAAYQRLRTMARKLGLWSDAFTYEYRIVVLQTVCDQIEQIEKGEQQE